MNTSLTLARLLPDGLDPQVMEAAAIADRGPIDPQMVPCAVCEQLALVHDDTAHEHEWPEAWQLAELAVAVSDRHVMDDVVDHRRGQYVPSGKKGPSPSDAGACRRQLWYRDRPPADYTPRELDERRAVLGELIHEAAAQSRARRYSWRRHEMRIAVPGLDRTGRVDEYDPVLGEVIDNKTAGARKWEIVGDDGPTDDAWAQVLIYGYALDAAGWPVKTLRIIVINRDTGAEEHFRRPYDPAAALAELDRLLETATMIEAGVVPPRDGYGPRDWRCQWCPALDHCWNTQRAAELDRGPVSLTLLGEIPQDPAIAWAARTVLQLTATRLAAEKAEDRAKDLLQGVKPDEYGADHPDGAVEVYHKWSTGYGYKEAYERLVAYYELPDEVRPPLAEVGEVPVSRKKTTAVKRVRAAKRAAAKKKPPTKKTPAAAAAEQVAQLTTTDGGNADAVRE